MLTEPRALFEQRVLRTAGCWLWQGTLHRNGYGSLKVGGRNGVRIYAHRLAYELFAGQIPEGLELDHLCRNRRCVNPAHLEPVTRSVNTLRGIGPLMLGAINGAKQACKNGHAFDEENTYLRPGGGRTCRECQRERRSARTTDQIKADREAGMLRARDRRARERRKAS